MLFLLIFVIINCDSLEGELILTNYEQDFGIKIQVIDTSKDKENASTGCTSF